MATREQKSAGFLRKWFGRIFQRRTLICLLLALQAAFAVWAIFSSSRLSVGLSRALTVLSVFAVLYIISHREKGAYKTLWVFLILLFPLFGGLLYIVVKFQTPTRKMRRRIGELHREAQPAYFLPGDDYALGQTRIREGFPQVRYLQDHVGYPVFSNTRVRYLRSGEEMLREALVQLEKAEKYIFLEYFIVQEGQMWDSILRVLRRKLSQGVQVRLIYDDLGCFFTLPDQYKRTLSQMGIDCVPFNPFRPALTVKQNNRDHRKILSIDGKVAFTGGINLADEYINAVEKFGHWKDTAVMVEGKAAWSFTLMFLEMWQLCKNTREPLEAFYPWKDAPCSIPPEGFALPYADSPLDRENVGEHVYLQIINEARDYVYITTPYLMIDDSVISALCLAAKRGVDVRILTPHRWDVFLVHMTTRSYYRELVEAGVKVYEYTRGFLHAKSFVSDDRIATNGTANLDYRSLYLHFECGVWIWGSPAVLDTKKDFLDTLAHCQEVTAAQWGKNPFMGLLQEVLRLFAPLM